MKQWKTKAENSQAEQRLRQEAGVSPVLARLLAARGFTGAEEAQAFLQGTGAFSPFSFAGVQEAAERILSAVDSFEMIAVYGDYDADGVTATAMLYSYLESCGANVTYYIPDREAEGYGLNRGAIDTLHEREVTLIITVDNGISSIDEVTYAASLGIDVVVTDHHRPRPELPAACAVVDPHREDCPGGSRVLSGVGVAFELILALEGEGCDVQGHRGCGAACGGKQDVCAGGPAPSLADGSSGPSRFTGACRDGRPGTDGDQRGVYPGSPHQRHRTDGIAGSGGAASSFGISGRG